ncbi:cytochrome P450 4d2-like isoform X2 [Episyrphus balteatus]|uniref:cytochrome P450 4d2-like isoform X2 n=1 Tax=Episyrphus balteatus TaxID=286459 RepID=UPI0024862405|nr:cytochrome P450 4d2-like isoform X2 [Episyrphus balteatus]
MDDWVARSYTYDFKMCVTVLIVVFLAICLLDVLWKKKRISRLKNIPSPISLPLIGCIWIYIGKKPDGRKSSKIYLITLARDLPKKYGNTFRVWIFNILAIYTSDLKDIQDILSNKAVTKKNRMYSMLHEWLGDGLLVSHGPKWCTRRKIITPTFHFKILEQFVEIFDRQSSILVKKLKAHANGQTPFDVHEYIGLATLDVISETAMGTTINAQTDENCEYVKLLTKVTDIFVKRFINVFYRNDRLFAILAPRLKKENDKVVNKLHAFTDAIIKKRKKELHQQQNLKETDTKQRMAFLDVLLLSTVDGKPLSNTDIREEVDTFMFAGHDTTKSAIGFTLYCISRSPEVQQKLVQEINDVIGLDVDKEITYRHLMDLKYTEKVIKESLRVYPTVPFIGRQTLEDCIINDKFIPKDTTILIPLVVLMKDPQIFPEPEKFLPERQTPDNPYAFLPFSAGPRNCIGQRYAMLEIKAIVTKILRHYELLPFGAPVQPTISVVLNSKNGWQMGFRVRDKN